MKHWKKDKLCPDIWERVAIIRGKLKVRWIEDPPHQGFFALQAGKKTFIVKRDEANELARLLTFLPTGADPTLIPMKEDNR